MRLAAKLCQVTGLHWAWPLRFKYRYRYGMQHAPHSLMLYCSVSGCPPTPIYCMLRLPSSPVPMQCMNAMHAEAVQAQLSLMLTASPYRPHAVHAQAVQTQLSKAKCMFRHPVTPPLAPPPCDAMHTQAVQTQLSEAEKVDKLDDSPVTVADYGAQAGGGAADEGRGRGGDWG